MSTVTRHALRVYAALSEFTGANKDILDALIPFFEPVLEVMNGKIFDPKLFVLAVQRLYRWRFTKDIAEHFIPRLHRKGYLERKGTARDGIYLVTFKPKLDETNEQPITQLLAKILDEFEQFPPKVTDLLNYNKTRGELTDILIGFLVSLDAYREQQLTSELGRLNLKPGEQSLLSQIEEGGQPLHPDDRYMAARFVQHLCKERPDYVPHLARLASVGLLTDVVQDFVKPTDVPGKVALTVILDAPLALDYLGCSGRELEADIKSVVEPLKNIGCSFEIFSTSCEEMTRNLGSMLALPDHMRHGYTHTAVVKGEVLLDYVRSVAHDPEPKLEAAGIRVRPLAVDQFPNLFIHFSSELYEDFYASVDWVQEVSPRQHDTTCMALIMRLRQGKQHSDLFRTGYVFVTRNPAFARKSRAYCVSNRLITPYQTGPVIHQRELAVAAWLRTGLGVNQQIPRRHLVATCDKILRVRPEVRDAVANTLAQVTPELLPQFEALLLDQRSLSKLADETLNDETVVSSENARHLLEVMRLATVEEEKTRHDAEMKRVREAQRQERKRAAAEQAKIAGERDAAQFALERAAVRDDELFADAILRTNRMVRIVELSILFLIGGSLIGAVIDYFTGWLDVHPAWAAVPAVASAFATYHLIMEFRQKPKKIGLAAFLTALARWDLGRKIAKLKLGPRHTLEDVTILDGKIALR